MQTNIPESKGALRQTVTTDVAAKALNRKPQTLLSWSSTGAGPIKPVRINGRLAWPVDQLNALLTGGANA